ncbi:MAG TPA: thioesterase family protein [Anaerolineales bacterium]|jgi:acyl-CoA thioester hydrolase|nr:thioesterase family protein [Anaerolineales bacterium]
MSRPFRFHTPIKVRYNETDQQGHVNFAHFLSYFDVGLTEYLDMVGYPYAAMLDEGVDIVYIESHCNYDAPVYWPEVLRIHSRIGHLGTRSIRFDFEIRAERDDRRVARGHIVAVSVTKGSLEPCPIPERLRQAVDRYEGPEAGEAEAEMTD